MTNPDATGIVIEGISGSGKSTLLGALLDSNEYLERGYVSTVILSEHHTQRVLEFKREAEGLTVQDNVELLRQNLEIISVLDGRLKQMKWGEQGKLRHRICYAMERFHLTHVCQYDHMRWDDVQDIDRTLADLGCKLCLLHVNAATIEERLSNLHRNEEWRAYLTALGTSDRHIVDYYLDQQEQFQTLCEFSCMPRTMIDTSEKSVPEIVAEVSEFWLKV